MASFLIFFLPLGRWGSLSRPLIPPNFSLFSKTFLNISRFWIFYRFYHDHDTFLVSEFANFLQILELFSIFVGCSTNVYPPSFTMFTLFLHFCSLDMHSTMSSKSTTRIRRVPVPKTTINCLVKNSMWRVRDLDGPSLAASALLLLVLFFLFCTCNLFAMTNAPEQQKLAIEMCQFQLQLESTAFTWPKPPGITPSRNARGTTLGVRHACFCLFLQAIRALLCSKSFFSLCHHIGGSEEGLRCLFVCKIHPPECWRSDNTHCTVWSHT